MNACSPACSRLAPHSSELLRRRSRKGAPSGVSPESRARGPKSSLEVITIDGALKRNWRLSAKSLAPVGPPCPLEIRCAFRVAQRRSRNAIGPDPARAPRWGPSRRPANADARASSRWRATSQALTAAHSPPRSASVAMTSSRATSARRTDSGRFWVTTGRESRAAPQCARLSASIENRVAGRRRSRKAAQNHPEWCKKWCIDLGAVSPLSSLLALVGEVVEIVRLFVGEGLLLERPIGQR